MSVLFYLTIFLGTVEAIFYNWTVFYFKRGLLLFRTNLPFEDLTTQACKPTVSLKKTSDILFLVRQINYGISCLAFFHGKVDVSTSRPSDMKISIFIDFNVLLVGAFLGASLAGAFGRTYFEGAAVGACLSYALCFLTIQARKKRIVLDCINFFSNQTNIGPNR